MANVILREKAQRLRKEGRSIAEIARLIGAPKSTVSYWCRGIRLTYVQIQALADRQKREGLKKVLVLAEKKRETRLRSIHENLVLGRKNIGRLSRRDLLIVGTALYWAEGYRKGSDEFGFTNSDPLIIGFIMHWLRSICRVSDDRFILRVSIHEMHKRRINEVIGYWSRLTKIPKSQFSQPSFIRTRRKKQYSNQGTYCGTLRIKVRRGTELRRRIMGWIAGLSRFSAR